MKILLQKVEKGQEGIIIQYHEMTTEISDAIKMLSGSSKLVGMKVNGQQIHYFAPEEVYYFESVDGAVYAYLERAVYRIREKLEDILCQYADIGIIRCSRTMLVNLHRVEGLKSQPAGRILAFLQNGEKIIVSRRYAGALRGQMKKGARA